MLNFWGNLGVFTLICGGFGLGFRNLGYFLWFLWVFGGFFRLLRGKFLFLGNLFLELWRFEYFGFLEWNSLNLDPEPWILPYFDRNLAWNQWISYQKNNPLRTKLSIASYYSLYKLLFLLLFLLVLSVNVGLPRSLFPMWKLKQILSISQPNLTQIENLLHLHLLIGIDS